MDFFEAIQILRRRWPVILIVVLAGVVAGFVSAPGEDAAEQEYAATTTLLANPLYSGRLNLQQAALLVTTGEVPTAVAEEMGLDDAVSARRNVSASADDDTASIDVTARRPVPAEAEEISASFARELTEQLGSADAEEFERQVATAAEQVADIQARVDLLEAQLENAGSDPALEVAVQAARQELAVALSSLSQLQSQGPPRPPLVVVEEGEARQVQDEGFGPPDGKPQRAALLGGFGLLLGLGAAFALDRLDTKVRNKASTAAAFGYPVIAEIPPLPSRSSREELLAVTDPSAPFVEAYRALRTVVALTTEEWSAERDGGVVIVVTSPGAGEGKTTTAAHLAAMLAEVGRSVLVVSADLRRPRIHVLLEADREPGLTELLSGDDAELGLRDLVRETNVAGVRLLPSGAPATNPAPLLRRAGDVLNAARTVFDFVVVDTAPLLVANDATELATVADGVIVLAHAARTSVDAAQRSAELLNRIGTPVLGAVLIAATDTLAAYGYYRNRYYTETEPKGRRSRARDVPASSS